MFLNDSILFQNASSCGGLSLGIDASYEAECNASLAILSLLVFVSVVGVVANLHSLVFFLRKGHLQTSDILSIIFASVNTLACCVFIATSILLLVIENDLSCILYTVLNMLLTRVSLYLFVYTAFNCAYETATAWWAKLLLALSLLFSVGETLLQSYVGCIKYEDPGVIFIWEDKKQHSYWGLTAIFVLNCVNLALVLISCLLVYLLYRSAMRRESLHDRFAFSGAPELNSVNRSKTTRIFRLSGLFGSLSLILPAIVRVLFYQFTNRTIFGYFININLMLLVTLLADTVAILIFVVTPFIQFWVDEAMWAVVKSWYCRKCCTFKDHNKSVINIIPTEQ